MTYHDRCDLKRLQATYSAATGKGVADNPAADPTALSPELPAQETTPAESHINGCFDRCATTGVTV